MGRIDDALRQSNVDVVRGTGAVRPAPDPSPWQFDPRDGGDAFEAAASPAGEPEAEAPGRPAPAADRPAAQWDGFDERALERLVVSNSAPPLLVEQFRSLAASLHATQLGHPLKSVIVTSASPGDGKSHVAVNLALTLSGSYQRRVLLIDADLRRPSLHRAFGVANTRGLADALAAKTDQKVAAVQISETLTLLPAGKPASNPLGGLSSERMKRIVAQAASRFDWVIVDSPPVGMLADARLVLETVDAALLVVRAGVTRFPDLEAAADTMGHERILGLVLNAADPVEIRGQGYYRDYYG